jgi:natural product precursor
MKKKSLTEKLVLNKTTISTLEQNDLNNVKGGRTMLTECICPVSMTLCGLLHCP